jgi:hypothetical protein
MDRRWIRSIGLENVSFAFESRHFLLGLAIDLAPKGDSRLEKSVTLLIEVSRENSRPFEESNLQYKPV